MNWTEYATRLAGNMRQVDISEATGISQGTVSRWLNGKGGLPGAQQAVEYARGLGGNPIEALVVLGIIRPDEVNEVVQLGVSGNDLSNGELVQAIANRLGVSITAREVRGA